MKCNWKINNNVNYTTIDNFNSRYDSYQSKSTIVSENCGQNGHINVSNSLDNSHLENYKDTGEIYSKDQVDKNKSNFEEEKENAGELFSDSLNSVPQMGQQETSHEKIIEKKSSSELLGSHIKSEVSNLNNFDATMSENFEICNEKKMKI